MAALYIWQCWYMTYDWRRFVCGGSIDAAPVSAKGGPSAAAGRAAADAGGGKAAGTLAKRLADFVGGAERYESLQVVFLELTGIVGMVLLGVLSFVTRWGGLSDDSTEGLVIFSLGLVVAALLVVLFLKCQTNDVARCVFFEGLEVLVQIYVALRWSGLDPLRLFLYGGDVYAPKYQAALSKHEISTVVGDGGVAVCGLVWIVTINNVLSPLLFLWSESLTASHVVLDMCCETGYIIWWMYLGAERETNGR